MEIEPSSDGTQIEPTGHDGQAHLTVLEAVAQCPNPSSVCLKLCPSFCLRRCRGHWVIGGNKDWPSSVECGHCPRIHARRNWPRHLPRFGLAPSTMPTDDFYNWLNWFTRGNITLDRYRCNSLCGPSRWFKAPSHVPNVIISASRGVRYPRFELPNTFVLSSILKRWSNTQS